MSIKNRKIVIKDGDVAFRICLTDAVEAFERVVLKDITFSVEYHNEGVLIFSPRDKSKKQFKIQEIQDALNDEQPSRSFRSTESPLMPE